MYVFSPINVSHAVQMRFLIISHDVEITILTIPRGLMARIPGFHPGGPGSIPGVGV